MPLCLLWLPAVLPSARAKVPAATAGTTSLTIIAEPCHCAGCGRQAGRYLPTCAASPGPRVGSGGAGQVRRCRQVRRANAAVPGQRAGLCLRTVPLSACVLRTGRASGLGRPVESCSTLASRRGLQQRWQLLSHSRALQRHVAVPVVTVRSPAISGCEKGPAAPAGVTSLVCGAVPRHRAGRGRPRCCHPRVRSGPAAPAVPASLTCDAALCRHAGRGHQQRCHKRVRKG